MKNFKTILSIIILMILITVGGFFIGRQFSSTAQMNSNDSTTKLYSNNQLGFSLEYPLIYNNIQESSDKVIFGIKDSQDLSGFGIVVENTAYKSTNEWLEVQPKGNVPTPGYEGILLTGISGDNNTAIVAEYMVVDHDGNTPIYGKVISAVRVENGKLYKTSWHNQFPNNTVPEISSETLKIIASFQVL